MAKVKLTITRSKCRSGYVREGQTFLVEDLCPPLCHELWNTIYPYVFVLRNGGGLDCGDARVLSFDAKCPDEGRVWVHGEALEDSDGSIG